MTRAELDALRRLAEGEPSMTRVALRDIGNPVGVRRALQREFETSLRGKESTAQLVDRLMRVASMSHTRAATIAQTERTRAANGARYAQAIEEYLKAYDKAVKGHRKRPALPTFQWINPRTAKEPRQHHVDISGKRCAVGEEFLPGLRYPGDPDAPARETINCHCYIRRWGE